MNRFALPVILALSTALCLPSPAQADSKEKDRQKIRKKTKEILGKLYATEPGAKAAISGASGYAVFSSVGTKILIAGGGSGSGVAIDNSTHKETFMKMLELQAGLGLGVKKFSLVWVFQTPAAMANFVNGDMEVGSQASAAAKTSGGGGSMQGAIAVSDDVYLYQLTEKGLALELTVKGTKYKVNDDLN